MPRPCWDFSKTGRKTLKLCQHPKFQKLLFSFWQMTPAEDPQLILWYLYWKPSLPSVFFNQLLNKSSSWVLEETSSELFTNRAISDPTLCRWQLKHFGTWLKLEAKKQFNSLQFIQKLCILWSHPLSWFLDKAIKKMTNVSEMRSVCSLITWFPTQLVINTSCHTYGMIHNAF
jgi:hypothetical protein